MNSLFSSISARDLRRAAEIKEKIDSLQNELAEILGSGSVIGPRRGVTRRKMSIVGTKPRWAKVRGGAGSGTRIKRSRAVRARLSAIARERWRKAKAAGKKTL